MDSALLKVQRASAHLDELTKLLRQTRPFAYMLETNCRTGERATYARRNEEIASRCALICGDIIHNLRSALDHAYWEIVSPAATTDAERRRIQFPFSETAAGLENTVRGRLADKVSPAFLQALLELRLHGEAGGNEPLAILHRLDITDKHRLLVPTGNYTHLSSEMLIEQVPDFPRGLANVGFGQNRRDVAWITSPMNREQRRAARLPASGIVERELDVPVEVVFATPEVPFSCPVLPTLHNMVEATNNAIQVMSNARP